MQPTSPQTGNISRPGGVKMKTGALEKLESRHEAYYVLPLGSKGTAWSPKPQSIPPGAVAAAKSWQKLLASPQPHPAGNVTSMVHYEKK